MKPCSWCDNKFSPKVSYQIYCSDECREQATKEKILERHKALRYKKRKNKARKCKNCQEPLSIYNDENLCVFCDIDPNMVNKALRELKRLGIINYEQRQD